MAVVMICLGVALAAMSGADPMAMVRILGGAGRGKLDREKVDTRVESSSPEDVGPDSLVLPQSDAQGASRKAPAAPAGGPYFRGVNPEFLTAVQDNRPTLLSEHDAWFHLFAILQRTDEKALVAASQGSVTYVQLFRQPAEYRGRLATVRGTVRRSTLMPAPKNEYGIERYYQLCLTPADNPAYVIVIYCLQEPTGFPQGDGLTEQASVTGFSYKRWPYMAKKDMQLAPVVLSKTLHWHKERRLVDRPVALGVWRLALLAIGSALAGVGIALVLILRTRSAPIAPAESSRFDPLLQERPVNGRSTDA
jgi:hypothetical protein